MVPYVIDTRHKDMLTNQFGLEDKLGLCMGLRVCYRETKDLRYLNQALKTFTFMKNHPAMPSDLIPYWDMDAPKIPNEPRDVSTASCMAGCAL